MAQFSQGPLAPATMGTDSSVGAIDWNNPNNAKTSDNTYAACQLIVLAQPDSFLLVGTNYGFTIPANAIIRGVQSTLERKASNNAANRDAFDEYVRLYVANVVTGDNKGALVAPWPTADTSVNYGADGDLWGLTLTPAIVNASGFGFGVAATINATAVGTVNVSHPSAIIWHTPKTSPHRVVEKV